MKNAALLRSKLQDGATIAIVGGGPAGSFQAIHLLNQARQHGLQIRVVIFERRRQVANNKQASGPYEGCPMCAGGISPRLNEALKDLGLALPPDVIQARITSITLQGDWKHIRLPVPDGRKMLSVYRGALPFGQHINHESFDSILLDCASSCGAELIGSRVDRAFYDNTGRPVLCYESDGKEAELTTDFAIFAGGVNERQDLRVVGHTPTDLFRMLQPAYRPPRLRAALIFELEAPHSGVEVTEGELHFLESSIGGLQLDMCSILPKRNYFTVTLIGTSVDKSKSRKQNLQLIRDFLAIPQVRRTLPPETKLRIRCICNPSIVVGSATMPYGQRVAAVGDMATSRQYKDGILSAHNMTEELAWVVFDRGVDMHSLEEGYGATLAKFARDNRYATLIFFMYRWFFTSPFLSRVIYQTYASEKKSEPKSGRSFEQIFWAISSGDQSYEKIAWSMLRPATLWKILSGGVYVTMRNWVAERFFKLDWGGIGRFPTAVSLERLEISRIKLLQGRQQEFECMYTIRLRADPQSVLSLLGKFGEPDRPYLNPRWVKIQKIRGESLQADSVIHYRIFGGLISFDIEQQACNEQNLILYEVCGSFANGGTFLFEIEPDLPGRCRLTVYLGFDYARGDTLLSRLYWRIFRLLFPEFIHEVLWNHALCEFKQAVEAIDLHTEPELIEMIEL
jgi:flavin-dependent dehydrogenase